MNFESFIERLQRIASHNLDSSFSSRNLKTALMDILNVPSSSDTTKFADWLKTREYFSEPFKTLVTKLTSGQRKEAVESLAELICNKNSNFKIPDDLTKEEKASIEKLQRARIDIITRSIESVFSAVSNDIGRFERANSLETGATDNSGNESKGKRFNPRSVAEILVAKLKRGESLASLKSYVSSMAKNPNDMSRLMVQLLKIKEPELVSFVYNLSESRADAVLEKFIDGRKTQHFMLQAKNDLAKNVIKLEDVLRNPKAAAERMNIPVEKIPELLKGHPNLISSILDSMKTGNLVQKALKEKKAQVNKHIMEYVRGVKNGDKNAIMSFFTMKINNLVHKKLEEAYSRILNDTVNVDSLDPGVYATLKKILKEQMTSQVYSSLDYFGTIKSQNLKDKNNKSFDIPVLIGTSGDSNLVKLIKKEESEGTKTDYEAQLEDLKNSRLELMKQKIRALPSELVSRIKSVLKINLGEVAYKKFEKNILDAKSFNEVLNAENSGKKSILDDKGNVLLNVIFEKAVEEIQQKLQDRTSYSSTAHIRAIQQLAKVMGRMRSKYYSIYITANRMERALEKILEKSGLQIDDILQRVELSDRHEKDRSSDRPTRGHRKERDFEREDEERIQKMNRDKRIILSEHIAKYNVKPKNFFDNRGNPTTSAVAQLYDGMIHLYNTSPSVRQHINEIDPISPRDGIRKWMTEGNPQHFLRILNNWKFETLEELKKDPTHIKKLEALEKEVFFERYQLVQKSLMFSVGFERTLKTPMLGNPSLTEVSSKFVPLPGKRTKPQEFFNLRQPVSNEDFENPEGTAYIEQHYKKLPIELQEKFQNMSLRGMVEAASNQIELNTVMKHIYDIVFTEDKNIRTTLDPFQTLHEFETSTDVAEPITQLFLNKQAAFKAASAAKLDLKANQREQEIKGIENTPGTYPAS